MQNRKEVFALISSKEKYYNGIEKGTRPKRL